MAGIFYPHHTTKPGHFGMLKESIKSSFKKGMRSKLILLSIFDQSLYFIGDLGGFVMVWDLRTGKGIY